MNIYKDPDSPVEVTLGETFAISLKSIPSTGYTWSADYDSEIIEPIESPKFILYSSKIGGGGEEVFNFRAKQVGKTIIKLKYKRDWETEPKDVKRFEVNITD